MDTCIITFRSVTPAQRGENLLQKAGIRCSLQRTPRVLAEQGCGYSIRLSASQLPMAVEYLHRKGIAFQKTYCLRGGIPEEVEL